METQLGHLVEERRSVDKETQGLRNQLAKAEDRVRVCYKLQNHLYVRSYIFSSTTNGVLKLNENKSNFAELKCVKT